MTGAGAQFDERAASWDDDPMKTARAQAVAAAIRQAVAFAPGRRGLEFGCGTGLLSFALQAEFSAMTLADSSAGMLKVLRRKIAAAGADHMRPLKLDEDLRPLGDERFDMIYSLMTLHHVADTAAIVRHFHGWLNEGGHLCIADLDAEDGSFHGHDPSVHNGFERSALTRQLTAAGFTNIRFSTVFVIGKGTPQREYPVFLMVAEKA